MVDLLTAVLVYHIAVFHIRHRTGIAHGLSVFEVCDVVKVHCPRLARPQHAVGHRSIVVHDAVAGMPLYITFTVSCHFYGARFHVSLLEKRILYHIEGQDPVLLIICLVSFSFCILHLPLLVLDEIQELFQSLAVFEASREVTLCVLKLSLGIIQCSLCALKIRIVLKRSLCRSLLGRSLFQCSLRPGYGRLGALICIRPLVQSQLAEEYLAAASSEARRLALSIGLSRYLLHHYDVIRIFGTIVMCGTHFGSVSVVCVVIKVSVFNYIRAHSPEGHLYC